MARTVREVPPPHSVFVCGDRMRYVLREFGGRIFYSRGGDYTHSCKLRTWDRWEKTAERIK